MRHTDQLVFMPWVTCLCFSAGMEVQSQHFTCEFWYWTHTHLQVNLQ